MNILKCLKGAGSVFLLLALTACTSAVNPVANIEPIEVTKPAYSIPTLGKIIVESPPKNLTDGDSFQMLGKWDSLSPSPDAMYESELLSYFSNRVKLAPSDPSEVRIKFGEVDFSFEYSAGSAVAQTYTLGLLGDDPKYRISGDAKISYWEGDQEIHDFYLEQEILVEVSNTISGEFSISKMTEATIAQSYRAAVDELRKDLYERVDSGFMSQISKVQNR